MFQKIPVTIITGFLGAGKTTLIRNLIENAGKRRIALVINEFGDIGVDGEVLKSCGVDSCREEDIVELANGCLCCTVADDFLPAIEALLKRAPALDHIIIETSGLALPKPLLKAFDWPQVRARITVDGVIAVVDAAAVADGRFVDDAEAQAAERAADPSVAHDNPLEEVYEDQLLCADLVILNKTDLLQAAEIARVTGVIEATNARVKIIATSEGRVDADIALGLEAGAENDIASRPSHHDTEEGHDHDDFDSFVLDIPPLTDPETYLRRLGDIAGRHDVLRMKGFLDVTGKPMRLLVQGVGARFRQHYDRAWAKDEARKGRLVVIGQKGIDRAAIEAALG
ncbi:cobalamin biosynthesis protein CobW [Rhodoblastus sphagnicola]|uniref:Cobalamin biosynthesis protein CobW n=1 Tax=Rhodoblastus sphagnicola TaxID=333368 RepID=A0A2S6N900_9HYPH|nr:cobalamin biosynthesis protein CobW [Rhodoblastus sphagnicola]MBB4196874.1 cobalamin biosynthesis protein CobW [Rhodoblastus sphagnicola]PPQ31096.1 cobalamin biosynthesis protein CobW [Rhodoblastus sphagnicola]